MFFIIYFFFVNFYTISRVYINWKRTGIYPLKVGTSDNAHDFIGGSLKYYFMSVIFASVVDTFFPQYFRYLIPIFWLENENIQFFGKILLVIAALLVLTGQHNMGDSWRIGIDYENKTVLIVHGLYNYSRNPIYVGLRLMSFGYVLALPTVVSVSAFIAVDLVIQIQVRLEEEFLFKLHGDSFKQYCSKTPRWLFV